MPIMKHGKKKREIKELLLMLKPLKMLLKQKKTYEAAKGVWDALKLAK